MLSLGSSIIYLSLVLLILSSLSNGSDKALNKRSKRDKSSNDMVMHDAMKKHMKNMLKMGKNPPEHLEATMMRAMEKARFRDARRQAMELHTDIRGFYHTSAWQTHWKDVVTEQLQMLDGTNQSTPSLLRLVDQLYTVIASSNNNYKDMHDHIDSLNLKHRKRLTIVYNATIDRTAFREAKKEEQDKLRKRVETDLISAGEYATIMALHDHCKQKSAEGQRAYVFYFHNKGGCCPKSSPSPVSDWRDEMNAFILEFPSICLRALNEGYST
jgi:hypothetical protein